MAIVSVSLDEIERRLDTLPPEKLHELLEQRKRDGRLWLPNPGGQTVAMQCLADELFFGGRPGGGKGGRPDDHVLTPFGWKRYGDLRCGDAICAVDGTVTQVIGVYPRGKQPTYRLQWVDGASTVVDADHIWHGWWTGKTRKIANEVTGGCGSAGNWITSELAQMSAGGRFAIPTISAPMLFNVAGELKGRGNFIRRTVHPYVLGVLIGDGCFRSATIRWTKPDIEIAERVRALVQGTMVTADYDSRCLTHSMYEDTGIKAGLEDLGLFGKLPEEKFLPRIYLFAPPEDRWELLRGLMDTDGWAEADGDCYYGTSSQRLADDVTSLARSLGALVSRREKVPSYQHNGETKQGLLAYTLRIKLPEPQRMFTLPRKIERCRSPQSMGRYLESIERDADQETICIKVRHPSSLYVTDDFVVTHNSSMLIGAAVTEHTNSIVFRREYPQIKGLEDEAARIIGTRKGYNASTHVWRIAGKRTLEFGSAPHENSVEKYQGRAHDLKGFDEITQFSKTQYKYLTLWLRSTVPGQRCRVIATGNPPTRPDGFWVVEYWAPWLDERYHDPALPGELRWGVPRDDDTDTEIFFRSLEEAVEHVKTLANPPRDPVTGEILPPRSRSFIPGELSENPDLAKTGYAAVLGYASKSLRSLAAGEFKNSLPDDPWQVIPTEWILAAEQRWTSRPPDDVPMTAIGVDVAQGGEDDTVLAPRHDWWFAPLIAVPGVKTPAPSDTAALVAKNRRDGAAVIVDCGGGYGGGVVEWLRTNNQIEVLAHKGGSGSMARSKCKQYAFMNKRAEVWWRFREALDPDQPGGSPIALPPDSALRADLAAPRYSIETRGVLVEPKEDVIKRIGRSPDRGDAVVMSWAEGQAALRKGMVGPQTSRQERPKFANVGYAHLKRGRRM